MTESKPHSLGILIYSEYLIPGRGKTEPQQKLCLQPKGMKTHAILPSREKKEISLLQFTEIFHLKYESKQRPSLIDVKGQQQDNRALLAGKRKTAF